MSIGIGINIFLYFKQKFRFNSKCLITTISLISILSTGLIVLNIILLVNIKKYSLVGSVSGENISLGFFNSVEIAQIESGVYAKDELYQRRYIATLEQILNSNMHYLFQYGLLYIPNDYYYFDLPCYSDFYKDCQNAIEGTLKIVVQYESDQNILEYNCAYKDMSQNLVDCDNLIKDYSLVLIRKNLTTISLPWKSIASCNQVTTFYIDRNSEIDTRKY